MAAAPKNLRTALRVLIVDDSPDDAELVAMALRRGGYDLTYERVDTPDGMRTALEEGKWNLVIADYSMPRFSGISALNMLRRRFALPFILVSGTVGEEVAVAAMKAGADDYVLKSNLARLAPVVERELRDFETRAARNRAEARYRSLVDRVPVGLFGLSLDGRFLETNPALVEMLGFPDAESLKQVNSRELWLRPEEHERILQIVAREELIKNFEMEVLRRDGSVIWCDLSARAIQDTSENITHYEGVLVDITSRKRAHEEADRARDRMHALALETAQLRSDFLASMSHEIRTPLVGIIGTGELLARSELNLEQRRMIEIIRSSGELLLTIVNDILDFSKLAAGKVVLEKLDFDLSQLIESTIDSFAATSHAKGVDLALRFDLNLAAGVRGDQSRLRQILNNLIANAIKFTERGSVTLNARLAESNGEEAIVRFEVVDTGIGIPLEARCRLFQPFVQAEGSTSRRFGGTGLGLVIAAKLTEQMGGEIGFESETGRGSTFHFSIRLEKGHPIAHQWMTASAVSSFASLEAAIVGVPAATLETVGEYLSAWGIAHTSHATTAEARDALSARRTESLKQLILLIDDSIHDDDALDLARSCQPLAGAQRTKAVILSAEGATRKMQAGIDACVTKPVLPSHLFGCLYGLFAAEAAASANRSATQPARPPVEPPAWRKAVCVLLVDDHPVNRTIGARQLSALGYSVEVADSARRALEIVADNGCDLVLMDCEMPEMDGYQAVAEIRRREAGTGHHLTVIALTAHATEGDRARCLNAGMDDYMSKPVKLDTLEKMLDTWAHRPEQAACLPRS